MKKVVMIAGMILMGMAPAMATEFDSAAWKAQYDMLNRQNDRHSQLAGAVAAVPVGTSREAVLDLLGRPDDDNGSEWVYVTGVALVGGEYTYLVITFGGDQVTGLREDLSRTYTSPRD